MSSSYNEARWTRQFLKRHRKLPPSLVVHLYVAHFRFEQHPGTFTYDSPMKCFLEAIREQKLPTDLLPLLDEANVRYYEGCLIVEVHDHRSAPVPATLSRPNFLLSSHSREPPAASKAELFRIVLAPNPATLWTQLAIQERKDVEARGRGWTEGEAIEIEAAILARTTAPLCLSPSIQVSKIANMMQLATVARPHKRKRFCGSVDGDEDDAGEELARKEREEHERMMKIGEESVARNRGNAFARLAFIESHREAQSKAAAEARLQAAAGSTAPPAPVQAPVAATTGTTLRLGGPTAAGLVSGTSTPHTAPSPAASLTAPKPSKKKHSLTNEDGTPAPPKKISKKQQAAALAAGLSLDPNDPTLPSDPVEKERVLKERTKLVNQRKKADAAKAKEKKKAAEAAAANGGANDLQVGGATVSTPPVTTPGARFVWNGGQ